MLVYDVYLKKYIRFNYLIENQRNENIILTILFKHNIGINIKERATYY